MKKLAILAFMMLSLPALAADPSAPPVKRYAIIVNDDQLKVLVQLLDIATKSGGLSVAKASSMALDLLAAAQPITEHVDAPAEPQKEPD